MVDCRAFSRLSLADVIVTSSGCDVEFVENSSLFDYFLKYLENQRAKSMVVEPSYVDRDFLGDYAGYYARCFYAYDKTCARLHFFDETLNKDQVLSLIREGKNDDQMESLQDSYIGFTVIKPLPERFIGRTCFRLDADKGHSCYPTTRDYSISLYGIDLTIETLAYQEQDQAAAACASVALWTTFQKTSRLFQHSCPSPIEVTKLASQYWPDETRLLPNRGLTLPQISYIVHQVGLEPEFLPIQCHEDLVSYSLAYVRAGIPVIMLEAHYYVDEKGKERKVDHHAVVITGFSNPNESYSPYPESSCVFKATGCDKLYVHDDQIGPFSCVELDSAISPEGESYAAFNMKRTDPLEPWQIYVVPIGLLVPLHHNIRLRIRSVFSAVLRFDSMFKETIANVPIEMHGTTIQPSDLKWDVFLTTVNTFKTSIRNSDTLDETERRRLLFERFPKHMWNVSFFIRDEHIADILIDATDVPNGRSRVHHVARNSDLFEKAAMISSKIISDPSESELNWFRRGFSTDS